jgi:ATP/maltotriose-dependent transcriptional regulator MalT
MNVASLKPKRHHELKVAIAAADANRRRELARLLERQGHAVVGQIEIADVVLADAESPMTERPVVTLGAEDEGQAGALPRVVSEAQLDAALRAAAAGLIVRAAEFGRGFGAAHVESEDALLLTPREVEVLSAIAGGLSNKAIAHQLAISLHTVKFHVESLFRKLRVRSRAEAVAKGLERRRAETVDF